MKRPKLGAHVSVAGKLSNGIMRAKEIGAECVQIFGASPRQWAVRARAPGEIAEFKKAREKACIGPVYLHAAYLVNLASADPGLRHKSEANLASHLEIAGSIGAEGLIFHIGSGAAELPKAQAKSLAVESLRRILRQVKGEARLVIENSAGGGEKLGADPEEIGAIMNAVNSKRLKVCWDTQHAFASGIIEQYDTPSLKNLSQRFERAFGLENLVALHINDSKTKFNSRHDRHENLGEGSIGLDGFRALSRETKLFQAAWILEVPGFDGNGPDARNISLLKGCFA